MLMSILLALALATPAHADEVFFGYGLGVFNDADQYLGQNKIVEIGYRPMILDGIYWQFKAGFWGEGSADSTRSSSFFVSTGPGMTIDLSPIEFRSGWGIAGISNPDSQLGSRFPQFNGEVYLGVRDKHGNGGGIEYNHLSCATLCSPNQGRDFGLLVLSRKF